MTTTRITSMTRGRFRELQTGILDGTLLNKWKDKVATTKSDIVEQNQIRAITMIYTNASNRTLELLNSNIWHELFVLNDNGTIKVQVR